MISVITPVYNGEKYIERFLLSLANQSYSDFELIIVDDGSQDRTMEIIDEFRYLFAKIKVISQTNQGQGAARNHGTAIAEGEFIAFIDSDDTVSSEYLAILARKQETSNADIVWCNASLFKGDTAVGQLDRGAISDGIESYILHNAGPCRKLLRKELFIPFPEGIFYEDLAVVPLWGIDAKLIAYVSEPLYNYHLHDGSTMHQLSFNHKLDDIFLATSILKRGLEKQYPQLTEFLLTDHLLHAASLRYFKFKAYDRLEKIVKIMEEYPNFVKNEFYRKEDRKYRLVCYLFYKKKYRILKMVLK